MQQRHPAHSICHLEFILVRPHTQFGKKVATISLRMRMGNLSIAEQTQAQL